MSHIYLISHLTHKILGLFTKDEWEESLKPIALDVTTRGLYNTNGYFVHNGVTPPEMYIGLELVDEIPDNDAHVDRETDITTVYFTPELLNPKYLVNLEAAYSEIIAHESAHVKRFEYVPGTTENWTWTEVVAHEGLANAAGITVLKRVAGDCKRVVALQRMLEQATAEKAFDDWLFEQINSGNMTEDEAYGAALYEHDDGDELGLPFAYSWGTLEIFRRMDEERSLQELFQMHPLDLLNMRNKDD